MARGGRIDIRVLHVNEVLNQLNAAISRVERGTKKATIGACEEIKAMSLAQVPRQTQTLADSFYYKIMGSRANFTAELGYGGNGNPVNPITKKPASSYMVKVHEDLEAFHIQGKAKFLEDPVREYQEKMLPGMAAAIRAEMEGRS